MPHTYPNNVKELLCLIYPYAVGEWKRQDDGRLEVLRAVRPEQKTVQTLPKNEGTITWTYGGFYFRLLSTKVNETGKLNWRGRPVKNCSMRFQVACPLCGFDRWFSVGKYMLHAKIHRVDF
jgi:hypothetical protein